MSTVKRKTKVSPTQLAMSYLRKRGVACEVVEKWVKIGHGGFRRDCFGFDVLGVTATDCLGIQAGIGAHHSEKIKKAIADPKVKLWVASPYRRFWVMTFSQRVAHNANGERAKKLRWMPRVTTISLENGKLVVTPFELVA